MSKYGVPAKRRKLNDEVVVGNTYYSTEGIMKILTSMISRISQSPVEQVAPELRKWAGFLGGLGKRDISVIAFVLKTLENFSERSYLDYVYFLLHPMSATRKCRPPGSLANPMGTELRCIRGYASIAVADQNDRYFAWIPQRALLSNPAKKVFVIGDITNVPTIKTVGPGIPVNYADHFKTCRLIAAEVQITVIQSAETSQGKVVVSPVITTGGSAAVELDQTALPTDLEGIFDNKIVYEGGVMDGVRMVYFPVHNANFDFHPVAEDATTTAHSQRMEYKGAFRGLPVNARIEIRSSMYFELTVADASWELISDPSEVQPEVVMGSVQNVLDALQEPTRNVQAYLNLRSEKLAKQNMQAQYFEGQKYINEYTPKL